MSQEADSDSVPRSAWIVSAVAVPLIIAISGLLLQRALAEQALRKDYVAIALQILTTADQEKQKDLRAWAADLLEQYSPLPLSPAARVQLGMAPLFAPGICPAPPQLPEPMSKLPPKGMLGERLLGLLQGHLTAGAKRDAQKFQNDLVEFAQQCASERDTFAAQTRALIEAWPR